MSQKLVSRLCVDTTQEFTVYIRGLLCTAPPLATRALPRLKAVDVVMLVVQGNKLFKRSQASLVLRGIWTILSKWTSLKRR